MTLEQLRIFTAVAECEHMTRAAQALRLSQSAVSGAIQALEARHSIALFHRVGRRIELTPDGRLFLNEARSVLRAAAAAELSLLELRGLKRGAISIHASQTTAAYWLPERLARFHAAYPDIDIRLAIGNTEQVARAVSSGEAEIGFVEGSITQNELISQQVDVDHLMIVVGPKHPWAKLRRLKPGQITQTKWVLRERGSGTRSAFEQALARRGISPSELDVTLELPSNEAVRAAVEAGAGATAISQLVVKSALLSKHLYVVPFMSLERPFVLLEHPDRSQSKAVQSFLAMTTSSAL
jgi:DNA-binding transcriptional LysR family regulator